MFVLVPLGDAFYNNGAKIGCKKHIYCSRFAKNALEGQIIPT